MDIWAKAPAPRHQFVLVSQTMDDIVALDHPVRIVDKFLCECDWKTWEERYNGHRGQPPIRPKWVAGAILYGMMKGIRSSRELEDATRVRVDFMWLLEGRTIDHSTFAAFRTKFQEELKDLNRQISRAVVLGGSDTQALVELVLDGTRVRANSERQGARTAAGLEKLIAACERRLNEKLAQMESADAKEAEIETLRRELEQVQAEKEKYRVALEEAQKRDAAKRRIEGEKAKAVRVPVTDPDSTILPNKEGGFAPNYTPTVAVDAQSGAIVSADVVTGGDEASAVARAVEDCEVLLGQKPDRLLADGAFASGANLALLEERAIEAYMNVGPAASAENPANRPDPSQPVAEERRAQLPRKGKQLASSAFIYDSENDVYHCPMGKILSPQRTGHNHNTASAYRTYACPGKEGCPLAEECVKGKAAHRTVARDQYQDTRDRTARRMASDAGRATYKKRAPAIESVFGIIKQVLGIRQFLLRGHAKVRTEWNWIRGAYNLRKIVTMMQARPAETK